MHSRVPIRTYTHDVCAVWIVRINLNINDTDHPLIIKVASIPTARMQVYFIDNEHYFKKKVTWLDAKDKVWDE